ncbi:alpha-glucuronidase [Mucilaginibacter daejeonensis]|uniref:alpha-glucuronidase family glycosyl hydrolase n=1 Tax=Mucilaginibacter daejeonensis TaxID=398049 RepID=UPI001D178966|nr:alpha-glucuronidase family glycosyl hydrolase [Mucilaginibacter daejeonensis]UEG52255.1 alpha-glucuronidase [Mucilaginibacter daejeonensis]
MITALLVLVAFGSSAQSGYDLWLNYRPMEASVRATQFKAMMSHVYFAGSSPQLQAAREELTRAAKGMLKTAIVNTPADQAQLIIGNIDQIAKRGDILKLSKAERPTGDGFIIRSVTNKGRKAVVVTGGTDLGVLYGVFAFLRHVQTNKDLTNLQITEHPKMMHRILDHWDNPNRSVERGYAGFSIWNWHKLPGYTDPRYTDYARANASVGINGSVLNNVNANVIMLTPAYLAKAKALADVFRPYGIKVYLSIKFSSPIELGKLSTADPLDPQVRKWWKDKVDEIYSVIPDFGGFLVKANSEGQPGPQSYGRTHADGANMLGEALAPHHGIVMWRAFVYDNNVPDDRAKQAYSEFKPLDGKFNDNVIVQVKNGAIDFQPREPFHPLFGAMAKTPLMLEVQLTQEYLGFSTHLVYEAPLFKECLDADTYAKGKGATVAKVLEGTYQPGKLTGMAGVANIGTDLNWCGHPFAQANWYSFGRLAWDPGASAEAIADDWLRMTFTNDKRFIDPIKDHMMRSRENTVNYMTPLGLHHIMSADGHYGPGPWTDKMPRADWTAVYYHKADSLGIGFDRTATGSNAVAQYFPEVRDHFADLSTCPDIYLLWFHHLSWNYKMRSGKTLWDELVDHYYKGAAAVQGMQKVWNGMRPYVDATRYNEVKQLMAVQYDEAIRWRNSCVLYFQTFSKKPIGDQYSKPEHDLQYYRSLHYYNVPGLGTN